MQEATGSEDGLTPRRPGDRGPPGQESEHGRCWRIDRAGHQEPLAANEWASADLQPTGPFSDRNGSFGLVRRFTSGLRTIGDWIFAPYDAEAQWRGWQITTRRAGLARTYRDPLFDSLLPCPRCDGSGERTGEDGCRLCDGTGRLVRQRPADPGGAGW